MEHGIKQYADIDYLTPENTEFYRTKGGFCGAKINGTDRGRVALLRMFPLTNERKYISVRDDEKKELGIIENIDIFSGDQLKIIEEELERRYFVPSIIEVKSVKEEFGYTYWETVTTAGPRNFTIMDMNNSLIPLGKNSVMLIDVDGNRYNIPDVTKLSEKALKFIDIWL